MPHVDPADLDSRGSVSVDVTDLHDAVLRQLGTGERNRPEGAGE